MGAPQWSCANLSSCWIPPGNLAQLDGRDHSEPAHETEPSEAAPSGHRKTRRPTTTQTVSSSAKGEQLLLVVVDPHGGHDAENTPGGRHGENQDERGQRSGRAR